MKILVVDDKKEDLYLLEILLKGNDYEFLSAANGEEALKKLRSHDFDMVIVDILMPVMDGFQLCRAVKKDNELKDILFVFYTATYTDKEDEDLALKLGADKFIRKPMDPEKFIKIIKNVIGCAETGKVEPRKPALEEEKEVLKLYNERLVNKLEKKALDLEREITQCKSTRKTLRDSESRYRRLVESTPDTILIHSEGKIVFVNPAGVKLTGAETPEQLIGKSIIDFVHPDYRKIAKTRIQQTQQEKQPADLVEEKFIRLDGREIDVEVATIPFTHQGNPETQMVIKDVTERKQMEDKLKKSERKFYGAFQKAFHGMALVSSKGVILDANQALKELLEYGDELIGKTFVEITHEEDLKTSLQAMQELVQGKRGTYQAEKRYITKRGKILWVLLSVSMVKEDQGISYFISHIQDLTEAKNTQAQLRQAQKMEAMGTCAGGIAHDFNNILQGIFMSIEQVNKALPENSLKDKLQVALRFGMRGRELIKQILTFSRQTEQERKPIQISSVVKETLKMMRTTLPATIKIQQNIDSQCGAILADLTQIHQVIVNLCTNADYAMRESGGILEVHLKEIEIDANLATSLGVKEGTYVRLTLSDTGNGIPPEILERIFDPFFTTKPVGEGTGLGLAVIHGIIQSHEGAITVESEVGEGTTFDVYFPVIDSEVEVETAEIEVGSTGKERILLIDDEVDIVELITNALENKGYQVTGMSNAAEALEMFRSQPHHFDIVITDHTMPRMTGTQLSRELINIRPGIPIILTTGLGETAISEELLKAGVRYLKKPFFIKELSIIIRDKLDT